MDIWGFGRDKENGIERDKHKFGLKKRNKEIYVDRQEIERDRHQSGLTKRYKRNRGG